MMSPFHVSPSFHLLMDSSPSSLPLEAGPSATGTTTLLLAAKRINPSKKPISWFVSELTGSPINLLLLAAIVYLLYKILRSDPDAAAAAASASLPPPVPPLKRRDFTLQQLRQFDGLGEHGRVLVAVNGKVFDVTKGRRFYGPGGPYAAFAGRDASRGLATFSVEPVSDEYDDLSDLKPSEMDQVKEWELQFSEKYTLVGKLLKPGEEPTSYSEEEEDDDDEEEEVVEQDKKND